MTALAHANPIHDEQGRIVGAVNILIDLTAQQLAQAAIQKLNESLEWQVIERTATLCLIQDIARDVNDARSVAQAMQAAL